MGQYTWIVLLTTNHDFKFTDKMFVIVISEDFIVSKNLNDSLTGD